MCTNFPRKRLLVPANNILPGNGQIAFEKDPGLKRADIKRVLSF